MALYKYVYRYDYDYDGMARPPGIPVRVYPGICLNKIPGGNSREFMHIASLIFLPKKSVFTVIIALSYSVISSHIIRTLLLSPYSTLTMVR